MEYVPYKYFPTRNYSVFHGDSYLLAEEVKYSIVMSTFNRQNCFQRTFSLIVKHRPRNTEIIIVDDHSTDQNKIAFLKEINKSKIQNMLLVVHDANYGAFHTKLDGFQISKGEYVMSLDDDDAFQDNYYKEIVAHISPEYDFIIPYHNFMIKYFDIHNIKSLEGCISGFHNHVAFAFKRDLLKKVPFFPSKKVMIVRDDAPLMIPLYIMSDFSKFKFFNNTQKYVLGHFCYVRHESGKYLSSKPLIKNGYDFLLKLLNVTNKNEYEKSVKLAYKGLIVID